MKTDFLFRQMLRKPLRTILYILPIGLLTAFFCLSLNLYANSRANLRLAEQTYSTIAVMELYAHVDGNGNIVESTQQADYAGCHELAARGYDLQPILNVPGVKGYDLRACYGAFIDGEIARRPDGIKTGIISGGKKGPMFRGDVIRFIPLRDATNDADHRGSMMLPADESGEQNGLIYIPCLGMNPSAAGKFIETKMQESAAGTFEYFEDIRPIFHLSKEQAASYAAEIGCLNGSESAQNIIFEPGEEYLAIIGASSGVEGLPLADTGLYVVEQMDFEPDSFYVTRSHAYSAAYGAYAKTQHMQGKPFWLYRSEDVAENSRLSSKIESIKRAYYINARSFGVVATNDVLGIPAFHAGNIFIKEGRNITKEEYAQGKAVCVISSDLARAQGWALGEQIELNCYEYGFMGEAVLPDELAPLYTYEEPDNFFHSDSYEIVGIYEMRPNAAAQGGAKAAVCVPWNAIYVPKASLKNAAEEKEPVVSGTLLTIWLENGGIEPFLKEMEALGVTGQKAGGYEVRFSFYDQGYSTVQPSLDSLCKTAELLLWLSAALLVAAIILPAFFVTLSQKQNVGIMRMLGASGIKALASVLLCALLIAAVGTGLGAAAGHMLSEQVGQDIIAKADTVPAEYLAFSAHVAGGETHAMEFALSSSATITLTAFAGAMGLFMASVLVLALRYVAMPPRMLLPKSHE